ncbi:hypothetical protein [Hymenobacter rubidus]|uniref:hypothetical protein n=1 Tax=Hymenobacter rubidus TaxID=1441626 RepID=UPI00191F5CA7|nr:hypothetical protein [Hymenobacter rubidus]
MYPTLLVLHSWSRWFVLIFGLIAVYRAYVGWTGRRPFVKADNGMSAAFSGFMWLQVLIGLGLYFMGNWPARVTSAAMDAATRSENRFFKMEHIAIMILAAILAQVGRIAMKKAGDDTLKHKKLFTYFGVALLLVLLMIPWGIWNPARPLFRF